MCYPIYNKNTTSRKYFLTIIYIVKHKLYFTNIFQILTNRTSVPILYCTTIRERAFGRGYLKLEISFYFFKNAKADSPVHSLLKFSIPPPHKKLQISQSQYPPTFHQNYPSLTTYRTLYRKSPVNSYFSLPSHTKIFHAPTLISSNQNTTSSLYNMAFSRLHIFDQKS
nr:MAG TPA: hypothetical protein [Bacteriophage sp.]